jgi:hypothetical protein
LQAIVHHVGLALGGRPGPSLARRLLLPVSKDTLLRVVCRCSTPRFVSPTVIGIDDCNGQTEGQITKLKLVKRQMYGRGKIDLLQARVIELD